VTDEPTSPPAGRPAAWRRALIAAGLRPRPGAERRWPWDRIARVAVFTCVIGLGLPLAGLYKLSTSPLLCHSCHIMKPYYTAWETSKHNFVTCVDCHYPPGFRDTLWVKWQALAQVAKWATQTYSSKPFAEIEDASCLRSQCHSTRLLEGRVTFKRGILFDHKPHLEAPRRGRQLRCTSCHSQIVVGNHMEVTETSCFLCHLKGAKHGRELTPMAGCPLCHQPPEGDLKVGQATFNHKAVVGSRRIACQSCHFDVIQGEGEAPRERCFTCHNQPEKLARYGETEDLHTFHVAGRNIECTRCHTEIRHVSGLAAKHPMVGGECGLCHQTRHQPQQAMYEGRGGAGAPAIPSHMVRVGIGCISCHILPETGNGRGEFGGTTFVASEAACVRCHGARYQGMLDAWKQTIDAMLADLTPKLAAVGRLVEAAPAPDPKRESAGRHVTDAKHNLDFVRFGRGVHNVFYAAELLQVADRGLDKAARLVGQAPPDLPKGSLVRGGYCATLCHDRAGVKVPEQATFQGTAFPHARHAAEFAAGCTTCHSAEKHKAVTITKAECQACHHGPQNDRCTTCHPGQATLYAGEPRLSFAVEKSPNVMHGTVECTGCHDLSVRHSRQAVARACTTCHDQAYLDLLQGWADNLRAALAAARQALRAAERAARGDRRARQALAALRRDAETLARSQGLHNPDLAASLLNAIAERAAETAGLVSKR
jgi:nitrate/TMAO reductase-like tetraheme cytochrome c subunit